MTKVPNLPKVQEAPLYVYITYLSTTVLFCLKITVLSTLLPLIIIIIH